MQSRDLATTSTDTAVSLWNMYRKALRWSVQTHTHLSAEYLHTTSASRATLYSPQAHLELLQNSLDATFELLSVEKEPIVVQSTLTGAAKVLQLISEQFVSPEDSASYAPILYYQFKYFDFLGKNYAANVLLFSFYLVVHYLDATLYLIVVLSLHFYTSALLHSHLLPLSPPAWQRTRKPGTSSLSLGGNGLSSLLRRR